MRHRGEYSIRFTLRRSVASLLLIVGVGTVSVELLVAAPAGAQTSTTTTLTSPTSGASFTWGDSITYTASVVGSDMSNPPDGEPVTFSVGGTTTLCQGSLSSGVASCATTTTPVGTDEVTATYGGDAGSGGNYSGSTSSPATSITVNPATPTTVSISNIPSDASYGGSFTAEVATDGDGTTSVTSSTTDVCSVGSDDLTVSFVAAGTCTLTAHVAAGTDYGAADGSPQSFSVAQLTPTPPTISDVPSGDTYGESFTAEVTTNGDGTTSVTSSTTDVCTVGADGLTVAFVGTGMCTLTAHVAAGTDYGAAEGSPQSFSIAQAPTTTTLSSISPPSPKYGDLVTYNVSVADTSAGAPAKPPSGTVNVTVSTSGGSVLLCTVNSFISAGPTTWTGSCQSSAAPVGSDSVTAAYEGDADFLASSPSTALSVTVGQAVTTTTISIPSGSYIYGDSIQYNVKVASAPAGGGTPLLSPSGTIDVDANTASGPLLLCTVGPFTSVTNSPSFSGECTATNTPAGSDSQVTATYEGDGNYAASPVSSAALVFVGKAPTTATVSVGPTITSVPYGTYVTYTVTVTSGSITVDGGDTAEFPTGNVDVWVGGSLVCAAPLDASQFSGDCDVATAPLGDEQAITAEYLGNTDFLTSPLAVASATLTVFQAPQSISFSVPSTASVGQEDALSATGGGSGNPVTFSVDPSSEPDVCSVFGTNDATARFSAAGTCVIDANQQGNADYAAASQVSQEISVSVPSGVSVGGGGSNPQIITLPDAAPPAGLPVSDFGAPISWTIEPGAAPTVVEPLGGGKITVTIPNGALPDNTTVSLYPVRPKGPLAASLPAGKAYIISLALSWEESGGTTPLASKPVTITIADTHISVGDEIYQATSSGLRLVGNASEKGKVSVSFRADPALVVASKATIAVTGSQFVVAKDVLPIRLACSAEGCSGTATLEEHVATRSKTGRSVNENIVLASSRYKFGKSKKMTLKFSFRGSSQSVVARAARHAISVLLRITVNGGVSSTRSISLR